MKFPVSKPSITALEKKYVNEALDTGWISSKGPFVEKFERAFADVMQSKEAVAVSSGTTALFLALKGLGIGPGDEVIVPEMTMVATAWAVTYTGARCVFVDCGDDLNLNIGKLRRAVTPKTKAVIPVHVYGRPADMESVLEIARENNLHVVEDAAEAHGATIGGRAVGSFGIAGCFSLFANKIVSSGEGGVITTNDSFYAEELRKLRAMYFDPDHTFCHPKLGYNFRMTNLQAAVALAQTERLPEILEKRRQIVNWYDEKLGKYAIYRPTGYVLWMYDLLVPTHKDRDRVLKHLLTKGVEARRFFRPVSESAPYATASSIHFADKARAFADRGLYLPVYHDLTKSDVDEISETFLDAIRNSYV